MTFGMDDDDKLQVLRPRYRERLKERVTLLESLSAGPWDEIHRLAHSMGSSAQMYGHPELAKAARKLEALCEKGEQDQAALAGLIEAARRVAG
jgi:HPt (histidine-containing phosphotransfer) domain-containing protein